MKHSLLVNQIYIFSKRTMPILNMVGGGQKGGNIGEPLNLTVTTSGLDATITWEDNEIGTIPPTSFAKSELVRKVGSAPTSPSDGDLVVTETVKDTYKVSGYVDSGLTDGTTYYYRVFSYSDLGGISYCDAVSVTPTSFIICDFTQSDEGFTYYNTPNNYGRDSNGFYIKSTASWGDALALIIPQTIIDMGTPTMIKLYGKNMNNNAGPGISEGTDTQFARCFNGVINISPSWGTPNNTSVSASAEDILVLDFDNEICYLESAPGTTATLYSSTILNDWGNGMNLCVLSPNSSNYGYLTKAEFYF